MLDNGPNPPSSRPSLYARRMSRKSRRRFAQAQALEGIDQEIALLRFRLGQILRKRPIDDALILKTISSIIRAVSARARFCSNSPDPAQQGIEDFLWAATQKLGLKTIPWPADPDPY